MDLQPCSPPTVFEPIRVALVEDDDAFQRTFLAAVATAPGMVIHTCATTLAQALHMLEQAPADVLVVDLGLPDGSGIDVIRTARRKWPACHAMVSTTFGDEGHVIRSLEAGAYGYLLKDSGPGRLVAEIRCLHAGGSPVSPLIARKVLARFHQPDSPAAPAAAGHGRDRQAVTLSAREREVLGHVMKGFTVQEIADFIGVSHHTVHTYVRRSYEKLGVTSRSEAIYEARQLGLLRDA
jgi:DNA-binding NarL/FixJ family response regulator